MKKTSVLGYPRIGSDRELKKWIEGYFKNTVEKSALLRNAAGLRKAQWKKQKENGIDYIPSNDFSFYDTFLDTACLLNVIPERYSRLGLDAMDTYFAMAKGYQGAKGDVHALPMKKWFNTNYHYIVPEIEDSTVFKLNGEKPFDEFKEAREAGIETVPVIVGPFTFLKLSENNTRKSLSQLAESLAVVYEELLGRFAALGAGLVQIDEPALVKDMDESDKQLFGGLYEKILAKKNGLRVLLRTYFGDVRDNYEQLVSLDFDAVGLDFIEGTENLSLIEKYGFPADKQLFAGVINGKNIWINNYYKTVELVHKLEKHVAPGRIVLSTSCSLLHVPYTVKNELQLEEKYLVHFAFAEEKLRELSELAELSDDPSFSHNEKYVANLKIIRQKTGAEYRFDDVREKAASLSESDFTRLPLFDERRKIQKEQLGLPLLPTTTIGSFPQTAEVRRLRRRYKAGEIDAAAYKDAIHERIRGVIALQEEIGLDVLVHGEFERNDMVEYFGEKLDGFLFTKNAWVQSYGTRCVKPPVVFGDVRRSAPMTVDTIKFAQSLTKKPVKGMLTGPVTILNWSFPREDLSRREIAMQIALAIKAEVEDLEAAGIRVIQIDEAALREKLPLRRGDWHTDYLDWAIPAFRLVHAGVKPQTQIHTHMCYSEFGEIIRDIDAMDADVITFEAAKSDLSILDSLLESRFKTEVGPGVYDIHSPRVPEVDEIKAAIKKAAAKLDVAKLWVNPDCGLKTRGEAETVPSLKNMVSAAKAVREEL